jgi:hypothetical protein
MIWRLLASVLAISDTGGLAVTSESSNWPTEVQCNEILQKFYVAPAPQDINGHRVVMKVSGVCVPVIDPQTATNYTAAEPWDGPYYGSPLYRRGSLPPSQRLAPY